jgi:hypothetical protein
MRVPRGGILGRKQVNCRSFTTTNIAVNKSRNPRASGPETCTLSDQGIFAENNRFHGERTNEIVPRLSGKKPKSVERTNNWI